MQLAYLGGNTGRRVVVLRMHVARMHAKRSGCTPRYRGLLVRAPRLLSHSIASATTHGQQHDRVDRVAAVQPMRAHEQRKYFHVR